MPVSRITASSSRRADIFFCIAGLLLFIEIFSFFCISDAYSHIRTAVMISIAETAFLMAPYVLLPPRFRRLIWIPFLFFPIFMLTELLYLRHFGNFYHGTIILAGNIVNRTVTDSAFSFLKPADCLILLPSLLLIPPYILFRKDILSRSYRLPVKIFWLCTMLIIPAGIYSIAYYKVYKWAKITHGNVDRSLMDEKIIQPLYDPSLKPKLAQLYGVSMLAVRTVCDLWPEKINLDSRQRDAIISILGSPTETEAADSIFSSNREKNLILLIVESLNSSVMKLAEASEICPELYRLSRDSNSIYVPDVLSQTGPGNSSDGQFMYNTGLYPLRDLPFVTKYGLSSYPALAKALPSHSNSEIIYEEHTMWNHWSTTLSYGYSHLYSNLDNGNLVNEDHYVIEKTLEVADTISRPFFLQVTTYSMHEPYDRLRTEPNLKKTSGFLRSLDTRDANYLESVNYFDRQLGRLIEGLDRQGILGNTVIAIIGDHSTPESTVSPLLDCNSVPLIIANAGCGLRYERPINQVDLFPILLDVMGVTDYTLPQTGRNYRGLGHSIFNSTPKTDTGAPADSIRALSELMILSRFFD